MRTKIMAALGVFLLALSALWLHGEMAVKATIEFPFMVEGKSLSPGQYEFRKIEGGGAFRVLGEDSAAVTAIIITRLSRDVRGGGEGSFIVFDTVGDVNTLAEIWLPGEDGYQLSAMKDAHTHTTVSFK